MLFESPFYLTDSTTYAYYLNDSALKPRNRADNTVRSVLGELMLQPTDKQVGVLSQNSTLFWCNNDYTLGIVK
jgi:hypothetical protein